MVHFYAVMVADILLYACLYLWFKTYIEYTAYFSSKVFKTADEYLHLVILAYF